MKAHHGLTFAIVAACSLTFAAGPPPLPKDPGSDALFFAPHEGVAMTMEERLNRTPAKSPALIDTLSGTSIAFEIHYMDAAGVGFLDPGRGEGRREVLREVLAYIDGVLDHAGDCIVRIDTTENSGTTTLASGGTGFLAINGFQPGRALLSILNGHPDGFDGADIFITVNFSANWQDTMAPPGPAQYDLFSVLLHEVTHGLGFLTLATQNGNSFFFNPSDPENSYQTYSFLDYYLYDVPADTFSFSQDAVYQGASFTAGTNTIEARGTNVGDSFGRFPPMHSPAIFSQGSSLSHWQNTTPTPADAVMRPSIGTSTQRRAYLPHELAFLADLGYTLSGAVVLSVGPWTLYE